MPRNELDRLAWRSCRTRLDRTMNNTSRTKAAEKKRAAVLVATVVHYVLYNVQHIPTTFTEHLCSACLSMWYNSDINPTLIIKTATLAASETLKIVHDTRTLSCDVRVSPSHTTILVAQRGRWSISSCASGLFHEAWGASVRRSEAASEALK